MTGTFAAAAAAALAALAAAPALAGGFSTCTSEPKERWQSEESVKALAVAAGYEVRKMKVEGSCYEVYGVGKDGVLMELFYDPVTGKLVHTEKKS